MTKATTVFGRPAIFGVEYAKSRSLSYIHVRLWIAGSWVGDIKDSLMPEGMCAKLISLASPMKYPKFAYLSEAEADCPTYEELVDRGSSSFGESFDPFSLCYYSAIAEMRVHFLWKLSEAYYPLFPDYPRHLHHLSVKLADYHLGIQPFIAAMIEEGYYFIRPGLPTLSDIERSV
jgi:hypothetical protein